MRQTEREECSQRLQLLRICVLLSFGGGRSRNWVLSVGGGALVGLGYLGLFCSPAASEACALMEARRELENLMVKLQLKKITIFVVARVLVGAPRLLSSGLSSTGLVEEGSLVGKRLLDWVHLHVDTMIFDVRGRGCIRVLAWMHTCSRPTGSESCA